MSKFSEFIKDCKKREMDFFFKAGWKKVSNKYFEFKRVVNDDEIIIVSTNVVFWHNKGQYVMFVDNNKVVYLKDWQVRQVKSWDLGMNAYIVKLNRQYFKSYQLPFESEDLCFEKEETFDDLLKVAQEQEKENVAWAFGQL